MTLNIAEQKRLLRKEVLAVRDALPEKVRTDKSAEICNKVDDQLVAFFTDGVASSFMACAGGRDKLTHAPLIALFYPLGSEVDLRPLMKECYLRGWDLALPVMFKDAVEGHRMVFVRVTFDVIQAGQEEFLAKPAKNLNEGDFNFGAFPQVNLLEIDAMIIPLVAFDLGGGRLGYGVGNYDRCLPALRGDCWLAGVAFQEQQVARVPRDEYDWAIPRVISA